MKLKTILVLGLIGILPSAFLFYFIGWTFAPGSYARAERYELAISEKDLIEIIKDFKNENPDLNLNHPILQDGRKDSTDYWYHVYFYYSDKNQIIHTWTRSNAKGTTNFAFVAINEGLRLGKWTTVNEYFWWWKNRPLKQEFEERILKGIKMKIKERKPNTLE